MLIPTRFAEMQLQRIEKTSRTWGWLRSLVFVVVGLIFGAIYLAPEGHQTFVAIGTIFAFLGAGESILQIQFSSLDSLIFQSRLLGILYLGLAAGSYVVVSRL